MPTTGLLLYIVLIQYHYNTILLYDDIITLWHYKQYYYGRLTCESDSEKYHIIITTASINYPCTPITYTYCSMESVRHGGSKCIYSCCYPTSVTSVILYYIFTSSYIQIIKNLIKIKIIITLNVDHEMYECFTHDIACSRLQWR